MSVQIYINYNGFLYQEDEPIFTIKNRGFRYGDALFESIRIIDGQPCFLQDHFSRLKKGMGVLKMRSAKMSFENIETQIIKLIEKNRIKKGGKIRLSLFRSGDGLYTPENESKSYVIEAMPLKENLFELNKDGLIIDVFSEYRRHATALSQIKTTNNIPHVLAGIFVKDNGLDDCLVINEHGRIVEASSSNIFLYKNNNIYTPSVEEGCMDGVMRRQILRIAKELNINVFEGMVNGSMLLQADELFLTNAIKGIQWVSAYRQKRFYNKYTKIILEQLNQSFAS
ncbi:MAG: 4-amino-4-deoxychorismate lyase [Flavobacteriales bacterium CG_4_10_14_0_2_um_filter_32_8]|nr:MAG: 4-amino-4-deoxychorismate lyase [Flavobacteriales bacterium CG_4_10_14_0_2_um_filter_32_8]PJB15959.1 MAG: 4-amino-4-deoxychorismate lyase [Flavobacteriales bacterium CG_4_9_14_3_um_filter_32_8]